MRITTYASVYKRIHAIHTRMLLLLCFCSLFGYISVRLWIYNYLFGAVAGAAVAALVIMRSYVRQKMVLTTTHRFFFISAFFLAFVCLCVHFRCVHSKFCLFYTRTLTLLCGCCYCFCFCFFYSSLSLPLHQFKIVYWCLHWPMLLIIALKIWINWLDKSCVVIEIG